MRFHLPSIYKIVDGILYVDGVSTIELSEVYDTPLYVMSERRIRENYRELFDAFSVHYRKFKIFYSAKANTNLTVLKILRDEGSCVDAVSPGEVFLSLEAGYKPDEILFTGTSVRNDEIEYLLRKGVTINVDSLSQMKRLLRIDVPETISVRVNPLFGAGHHQHVITAGKDSKFGVWDQDIIRIYRMALKGGVKKFGIHMHIGSGVLHVEPYLVALRSLIETARKVVEETGITFDFIDVGGGFGVPYKPEDRRLDINLLSRKLTTYFLDKVDEYSLGEPYLYIEPGRYIVCDAGILLTRVNTIKVTPHKVFIGVDAGFNTLVRPVMYGSYHHVLVANKVNARCTETYTIVGPICESGDILAKDRSLPKVEEGDVLAILNAGAYGFSMCSQYNSRPRPAEVIVKDGKHALIRRREDLECLLERQLYPPWLASS